MSWWWGGGQTSTSVRESTNPIAWVQTKTPFNWSQTSVDRISPAGMSFSALTKTDDVETQKWVSGVDAEPMRSILKEHGFDVDKPFEQMSEFERGVAKAMDYTNEEVKPLMYHEGYQQGKFDFTSVDSTPVEYRDIESWKVVTHFQKWFDVGQKVVDGGTCWMQAADREYKTTYTWPFPWAPWDRNHMDKAELVFVKIMLTRPDGIQILVQLQLMSDMTFRFSKYLENPITGKMERIDLVTHSPGFIVNEYGEHLMYNTDCGQYKLIMFPEDQGWFRAMGRKGVDIAYTAAAGYTIFTTATALLTGGGFL